MFKNVACHFFFISLPFWFLFKIRLPLIAIIYCIDVFQKVLHRLIFNIFKHKELGVITSRLNCPINRINSFNADVDLIQLFVYITIWFILQKNIFICATDFTLTFL